MGSLMKANATALFSTSDSPLFKYHFISSISRKVVCNYNPYNLFYTCLILLIFILTDKKLYLSLSGKEKDTNVISKSFAIIRNPFRRLSVDLFYGERILLKTKSNDEKTRYFAVGLSRAYTTKEVINGAS